MANASRQLGLPFPHAPHLSAADFLEAGSNVEALAWLDRSADWPQGRLVLWGGEGRGKTHLLHVWANRSGGRVIAGPALRLEPPTAPLAVDDADSAPERTLLHLLNAAAEARLPVLLSGREPPARWEATLPDLTSRLRAAANVEIRAPEDTLLRALLARLLAERQLAVPEALQDWLRLRLPRTPAALREAAARLDRGALASGGRVTRALAADIAASLDEQAEGASLHRDEVSTHLETASPALLSLL